MKPAIAIAALFSLAFAAPASAQDEEMPDTYSVAEHVEAYNAGGELRSITLIALNSYAEGAAWLQSFGEEVGNKPIYCPPREKAFTADEYHSILMRFVNGTPIDGIDQYPLAMIMIVALQEAYPCSGN